ncbi:MAG: UMP kinase [Acidiferrobacterales bacterium]|nr:UMP kinase [Acidiferrobacterales bacterium]
MSDDSASGSHRTILFKLSGELLGDEHGSGIDPQSINRVADEIAQVVNAGVRTGMVIGGGNFFRGGRSAGFSLPAVQAHQMGMLFTIANAIALEQALLGIGVPTVVQSAIAIPSIVDQFDGRSFVRHLDEGSAVIFAGGTGSTHFSTDTAASLRAIQIGADILLKATQVDGIYSSDPKQENDAKKYDRITYDEVLMRNLAVMDAAAIVMCREHNLPIQVFDATVSGGIARAGLGGNDGTVVARE